MNAIASDHILVPVDFSDQSFEAIDVALDIADDPSKVAVVHVLPERQMNDPDLMWQAIDHAKRRNHTLEELRSRLSDAKYRDVELDVLFGDPGYRIPEFAKIKHTRLIVLPSHGRTGVKRMLIGSVAERVVRHAHCPVLVLRS